MGLWEENPDPSGSHLYSAQRVRRPEQRAPRHTGHQRGVPAVFSAAKRLNHNPVTLTWAQRRGKSNASTGQGNRKIIRSGL